MTMFSKRSSLRAISTAPVMAHPTLQLAFSPAVLLRSVELYVLSSDKS